MRKSLAPDFYPSRKVLFRDLISPDEAQQIQQVKVMVWRAYFHLAVKKKTLNTKREWTILNDFHCQYQNTESCSWPQVLGLITCTTVPTKKCHQDFLYNRNISAWLLSSLQWFSWKIMNNINNKHFPLCSWININALSWRHGRWWIYWILKIWKLKERDNIIVR